MRLSATRGPDTISCGVDPAPSSGSERETRTAKSAGAKKRKKSDAARTCAIVGYGGVAQTIVVPRGRQPDEVFADLLNTEKDRHRRQPQIARLLDGGSPTGNRPQQESGTADDETGLRRKTHVHTPKKKQRHRLVIARIREGEAPAEPFSQ